MDQTNRQITKIARDVSRFTTLTLKSIGIGPSEIEVLHVIRKNPGITAKSITLLTGIDKGALARQLTNLENKQFIKREANPQDQRSQLIYATQLSDQFKNSKANIESQFYEFLFEDFSEEEKQQFTSILNKVYQKCKSERKQGFVNIKQRIKVVE